MPTPFRGVQARYVRVPGAKGTVTPVTELELHAADVLTFENDPLYGIPRGFVDARNTTVSDQELKGHDSSTSRWRCTTARPGPRSAGSPRPCR